MSKPTKKELLRQLLDLEDDNVGDNGKTDENTELNAESINDKEETITKPKKQLTEKQLEALKKGQATRDANIKKRKEEAQRIADEEKKKLEEKIVKKAISIKKKQIKKQSALDEIEDDETPIQKIKELAIGTKVPVKPPIDEPSSNGAFGKPKINFF